MEVSFSFLKNHKVGQNNIITLRDKCNVHHKKMYIILQYLDDLNMFGFLFIVLIE
jgi:hypothetical protein